MGCFHFFYWLEKQRAQKRKKKRMFQSVVLQIVIPFIFGDYQMLAFDQVSLASILAIEIDKQIGGKVYQNQLLRKGAKYITVKSYDCPEASDHEILFTVQFEAAAFFPLCSPEVVYQMKVVEKNAVARELRCEWPDPITGIRTMIAIVEVPVELFPHDDLPPVNSLIYAHLLDFQFEYDNDHVKCIGRMVNNTS